MCVKTFRRMNLPAISSCPFLQFSSFFQVEGSKTRPATPLPNDPKNVTFSSLDWKKENEAWILHSREFQLWLLFSLKALLASLRLL